MVSDTLVQGGGWGTGWFLTGLTGLRGEGRNAEDAEDAKRGEHQSPISMSFHPKNQSLLIKSAKISKSCLASESGFSRIGVGRT